MTERPRPDEYAEDFESYIQLVPEGDISEMLQQQIKETASLLNSLSEEDGEYRYAPNKWSIKEVVGHMADTEWIMNYRMLSIARGETAPLPGYNDEEYVKAAAFNDHSLTDLTRHFTSVRQATLSLLNGLSDEALKRRGAANNEEVTARALAFIIAGHELHHRNLIKERYLK
ncbi:DinB superfamily protein [Fictibacillus solisalsi]|uniref:DinB superfamily protein n=1 Tax=Fictibacillus solisalsi TaxID=459525 RepID=A0A1H0A1H6_9BACL|nr:DinB family protein [Fictibacillus solisalsi]SDN26803.1 DinB superfamily protein [Fictibacillus solisalsi]